MSDKKETKFNLEGIEEIVNDQPAVETENILTDNQMQEVQQEVELEREYGDSNLRTALEAGASAATFGISDKVLTEFGGEEARQGLRERRQRNQEAALAGEIAGVVLPTLASGGTSLAAKGASAGVSAAAKAGGFIERISAKQLASIANATGRSSIAKSIIAKGIPKTAGSAVEGAFYGAGQLLSEDALGTAEFNAENLVAYAGTAALIGGAAGGVLGSAEAILPVIKGSKIVDVVSSKINTNINKSLAGAKIAGMIPSQISKLKSTSWGVQIWDNIPSFFKNNLKLKRLDSTSTIFTKASKETARLGKEIGETALEIDKIAKGTALLPTKSKVAVKVQNSLRELEESFLGNPDSNAQIALKKIELRMKSWDDWLNKDTPIEAVDIKKLKTSLQDAADFNKSLDSVPLDGKMNQKVAEAVRQEFLELADGLTANGIDLGEKLRKLNLDFGTGITLSKNLRKAVDKEASKDTLGLKDIFIADMLADFAGGGFGLATTGLAAKKFMESNFKRKLILLTDMEKANIKVSKKITNGVKGFFTNAKKSITPVSTTTLLNTSFSLPSEDGKKAKKPSNKKEAFKKLSEDLIEMQNNPERLMSHLATNSLSTTKTAENTALAMSATLSKAVGFLNEKLPKDPSPGTGLFAREYTPSSLELAKFERYLTAVENPMSVMDDLESGGITSEAVEAIRAVYPDMYIRIQEQAMTQIAENPDISYNKRLQLGMLLELASDTSLIPANINALQQTFTDEEQAQTAAIKDANAVTTTQAGLENITFAEDAKSSTEKIATRK